jgi:polyphosphate kinase
VAVNRTDHAIAPLVVPAALPAASGPPLVPRALDRCTKAHRLHASEHRRQPQPWLASRRIATLARDHAVQPRSGEAARFWQVPQSSRAGRIGDHVKKKRRRESRRNGDGEARRMKQTKYEKALNRLQTELCHLQRWVKEKGLRVIIIFEGRDGAGKGGTIRVLTERLSPRVFRVIALPAPSDRETSQVYMQRYLAQFPSAGEVVIFDRSWYNRAGVEPVMGFCTPAQHRRFLEICPEFEHYAVDEGIILIKLWLEVSNEEQERRFKKRIEDPRRQWKLSPMDLSSRERWYEYSRARALMLKKTDTRFAPWYIVRSDDKRAARLNTLRHVLAAIPYKRLRSPRVELSTRAQKKAYNDRKSIAKRRFVEEYY